MNHSHLLAARSLMAVVLISSAVWAQQKPPMAPALPAINPAQARLDQTVGGLDGPGFAIAFSEELGIAAVACEHGAVHILDKDVLLGVRAGDKTPNVLRGHEGPVLGVAWNGGPVLASGGADQKIILWAMPAGKPTHTLPAGSVVRTIAMSPDGKTVASSNDDFSIQLTDVAAGKLGNKLTAHTDRVVALAFSPDGKQLASGGYDGVVRLWEVGTWKKLLDIQAKPPVPPNTPPTPDNVVQALAFSPPGMMGGPLLAIGGSDTQIHLVNPADGKIVRSIPGHTSSVSALAFHPSGTLLASGSKDRTLRLWNPANGQPARPQPLDGHTSWVQGLTFMFQGTRIATVGADQTVRLWDLKEPAKK